MTLEQEFRQKLRKIEALFAGAATKGERLAAGAAAERIRDRLDQAAAEEEEIEMKFSISDAWSRQLFVALCRRYGLRPFRYRRMHRCQRRSKSTPLAGVKMHHLMRFSPALAVVPVVHRRDPRCFV